MLNNWEELKTDYGKVTLRRIFENVVNFRLPKSLKTYTTNGAIDIDNNKSERALRSMAVGRKNWLFMGSKMGGRTNCIIASFISTCKAHDIHPRLYLEDVLTRLARGETDLESLLPDRWQSAKP